MRAKVGVVGSRARGAHRPHSTVTFIGVTVDNDMLDGAGSAPSATCMSAARVPSIVFIKTPKCASSTAGGIVRRIAWRHNLSGARDSGTVLLSSTGLPIARSKLPRGPFVWASHASREKLQPQLVSLRPNLPLLVSIVREPAARALSSVYFFTGLSRGLYNQSVWKTWNWTDVFMKHLNSCESWPFVCPNFMLRYIRWANVQGPHAALRQYSLVGVAERLDVFAVLLANLTGVPLTSVLYANSKMVDFPRPETPAAVRHFIDTEWATQNQLDFELYNLSNARLDEQLAGNEELRDRLVTFRNMQALVATSCRYTDADECLWLDNGCGFACHDRLTNKLCGGRVE